eukprot:1149050-Pelagomonas_calceolata.AAC.3
MANSGTVSSSPDDCASARLSAIAAATLSGSCRRVVYNLDTAQLRHCSPACGESTCDWNLAAATDAMHVAKSCTFMAYPSPRLHFLTYPSSDSKRLTRCRGRAATRSLGLCASHTHSMEACRQATTAGTRSEARARHSSGFSTNSMNIPGLWNSSLHILCRVMLRERAGGDKELQEAGQGNLCRERSNLPIQGTQKPPGQIWHTQFLL